MDLSLRTRVIHRLATALVAAGLLLVAGLAADASAAPLRGGAVGAVMRVGRAPIVPAGAAARGALPRTSVIDATVALQPRDPAALAAYAQAVSKPGSSLYHRYLSVAQFAQRFAPGVAEVASVRAALQAQGLHPGPLAANGLSLDVTASAGAHVDGVRHLVPALPDRRREHRVCQHRRARAPRIGLRPGAERDRARFAAGPAPRGAREGSRRAAAGPCRLHDGPR